MLKHAVKRLLVLLPAVWLIASSVFLLSKTVPGSAAEMQFEAAAQNANSLAKAEAYERAYRQSLHKTGQDLPLFYFGIGTAAQPDTLSRIFPETDRQALLKMVYAYGNWPEISAYYQSFQELKKASLRLNDSPETKSNLNRQLYFLLPATNSVKTSITFRNLKALATEMQQPAFSQAVAKAEQNFERITTSANPNLNYVPAFHWHGLENQYHRWFRNLLRGDLGFSSRDSRPVTEILAEAFGVTIWLALAAFLLVSLLAPQIAMVLSRKSSRRWQPWVLNFLYGLESIPLFLVALFLLALSSALGLLYDFPEEVSRVLVVLCLVLVNLPYLSSQAFFSMQTELKQNYALTARAKGLPDKLVLRQHIFRNSLLPVITSLSDFFPALLAGTVILEVIFSVPGVGRLLVSSVLARDYEVIAALVLFTGLFKMASHLLADLLYAFADPRIRR